MSKHIQLFDTAAAYDAAEHDYPNVSYVEATSGLVYTMSEPTPPTPPTPTPTTGWVTVTPSLVVDGCVVGFRFDTSAEFSNDGSSVAFDDGSVFAVYGDGEGGIGGAEYTDWEGNVVTLWDSELGICQGVIQEGTYCGDNTVGQVHFSSASGTDLANIQVYVEECSEPDPEPDPEEPTDPDEPTDPEEPTEE